MVKILAQLMAYLAGASVLPGFRRQSIMLSFGEIKGQCFFVLKFSLALMMSPGQLYPGRYNRGGWLTAVRAMPLLGPRWLSVPVRRGLGGPSSFAGERTFSIVSSLCPYALIDKL